MRVNVFSQCPHACTHLSTQAIFASWPSICLLANPISRVKKRSFLSILSFLFEEQKCWMVEEIRSVVSAPSSPHYIGSQSHALDRSRSEHNAYYVNILPPLTSPASTTATSPSIMTPLDSSTNSPLADRLITPLTDPSSGYGSPPEDPVLGAEEQEQQEEQREQQVQICSWKTCACQTVMILLFMAGTAWLLYHYTHRDEFMTQAVLWFFFVIVWCFVHCICLCRSPFVRAPLV